MTSNKTKKHTNKSKSFLTQSLLKTELVKVAYGAQDGEPPVIPPANCRPQGRLLQNAKSTTPTPNYIYFYINLFAERKINNSYDTLHTYNQKSIKVVINNNTLSMQTTKITTITTILWNLPKKRRDKILSITEFIFHTKVDDILHYNPTDTNINNIIQGSFNNIKHQLFGTNSYDYDTCFVSILYNNNIELFQYLLDNMDNTYIIETLPSVFDYIKNTIAREAMLKILNSVFTINLIKERLSDELYWYKLRNLFTCYANKTQLVSNHFNLSYINGLICSGITVNKVDDVNYEMSIYFVPDYTSFGEITILDITTLYNDVKNAPAQNRQFYNMMNGTNIL